MNGFSKVILIGNLVRNPELRYTPSGTPVATFSLAINRKFKQGEELREEVCYIDVVIFGKLGERCSEFLSKGNGVTVEGRLQQRRWETQDQQKRSKHEVVAQQVIFHPKSSAHTVENPGHQEEYSTHP
jgi:single-strand DNA-binding protein